MHAQPPSDGVCERDLDHMVRMCGRLRSPIPGCRAEAVQRHVACDPSAPAASKHRHAAANRDAGAATDEDELPLPSRERIPISLEHDRRAERVVLPMPPFMRSAGMVQTPPWTSPQRAPQTSDRLSSPLSGTGKLQQSGLCRLSTRAKLRNESTDIGVAHRGEMPLPLQPTAGRGQRRFQMPLPPIAGFSPTRSSRTLAQSSTASIRARTLLAVSGTARSRSAQGLLSTSPISTTATERSPILG